MNESITDKMLDVVSSNWIIDQPRPALLEITNLSENLPLFYGMQFREKVYQIYGEEVLEGRDPAVLRSRLIDLIEATKQYEEVEPEIILVDYAKTEAQVAGLTGMGGNQRIMLLVQNHSLKAFFEKNHLDQAKAARKNNPLLKHARITEVWQALPSQVEEGKLYNR